MFNAIVRTFSSSTFWTGVLVVGIKVGLALVAPAVGIPTALAGTIIGAVGVKEGLRRHGETAEQIREG